LFLDRTGAARSGANPIAKAQAALDWRLERQRANEAVEREYQRRLRRELDPFNWTTGTEAGLILLKR
jgi:hypothetical protein